MKDKTTKMLQKCSLGAKMGVSGINAAQRYVGDPKLLFLLSEYKEKHRAIAEEADALLHERGEKSKSPSRATLKIARAVTAARVAVKPGDMHIAQMMIRSGESALEKLAGLLSSCKEADASAKETVKKTVLAEQEFLRKMRECL